MLLCLLARLNHSKCYTAVVRFLLITFHFPTFIRVGNLFLDTVSYTTTFYTTRSIPGRFSHTFGNLFRTLYCKFIRPNFKTTHLTPGRFLTLSVISAASGLPFSNDSHAPQKERFFSRNVFFPL